MKLRFRPEKRTTQVRVFANREALLKVLKRKAQVVVWDEGLGEVPSGIAVLPLPGGEGVKQWRIVESVLGWLHKHGHERSGILAAVGGGAVCDVTALAASLYRRGIPLILVPTTLLAQVDAAIGGKTAVDAEDGRKNFAGTFYPADEVWLCPEFLISLQERERRSGAGELLKILWTAGAKISVVELREWIETGRVSKALWLSVLKGVKTKIKIVEKDPLDTKRVREVLNFGHTVGHALEALGDGAIPHGEAIAWGMAVEAGLVRKGAAAEISQLLLELGMNKPNFAREFSLTDWLAALAADKKMQSGKLAMSVLDPLRGKKIHSLKMKPRAAAEAALRFFR